MIRSELTPISRLERAIKAHDRRYGPSEGMTPITRLERAIDRQNKRGQRTEARLSEKWLTFPPQPA